MEFFKPMEVSSPLILFLITIVFRNIMQLFLTRRKIKGTVLAKWGTLSFYLCYLANLCFSLSHLLSQKRLDFFFALGFGILWLGILMRVTALRQLGRFYSSSIELRKGQKLITSGMFSLIRHPLHFSILMEVAGMGILSANVFSLVPVIILLITITLRNKNEEEALRKYFGREYEEYHLKVPSMNLLCGLVKRIRENR